MLTLSVPQADLRGDCCVMTLLAKATDKFHTAWYIMMPGLGKARAQAQTITCRKNLKQLPTALSLYHIAHDNKTILSKGGGDFWFTQIAPYMGDRQYKQSSETNSKEQ